MIVGAYVLNLYCDNYQPRLIGCGGHEFGEFPHQYVAQHGSTCRRRARAAGWKLNLRTDKATCPRCNGIGPSDKS